MQIVTGFHAIEERIRSGKGKNAGLRLYYSKAGPRVKRIIEEAEQCNLPIEQTDNAKLDTLSGVTDHRGVVLIIEDGVSVASPESAPVEDGIFDAFIQKQKSNPEAPSLVVILDSITDPHNVGAIIRSCDQFGVDMVVIPERRSAKDSVVIGRSSAGASSWVPLAVVPNLVRAADQLRDAGFWIFGADGAGTPLSQVRTPGKTVLVMGSEGKGIGRLLRGTCDALVAIETRGRLDSLNVSVAAGILLYEICNRRALPVV
ncbi:MAG: 23S rRNA (guanosine(2251)-2'-O)-methyltransferase RlmB [Spirochaetaceae bacterium]|jgi:23S rRNA (guanosine2251-2'-O)-methyltransferase|nr:23S rRNA (guanosine(2251)-2'-O)-methyltransferase RlmB [Spirochaetaceae bacterium]